MNPLITVTEKRRICHVEVVGLIWMPQTTCAMKYQLSDYDLENMGEFTRESVDNWLSTHAGDFSSITDFHAVCGKEELPWESEENELTYQDCMYGEE